MKVKKILLIIAVIISILAVLVALIKLDVGKIGSKYASPKLKKIPVIKYILPKDTEKNTEEDSYANYSKDQLINILNGSEVQLEEAKTEIEKQNNLIVSLEQQIKKLEVFEKEHTEFKEQKKEFDEQIAYTDKNDFKKFYESMYPEHAKDIYADIVKIEHMTKEQKKYSAMIAEMDEAQAAKVLENLVATDIDIVISILSNMDMEGSAAILNQMDHKIAATVIKQLSP